MALASEITFIVVLASLTFVLLTYILYTSRFLGWLVSKVLRYVLRNKQEILSIRSICIAPLAGRIFFKDLRYTTKNMEVKVVDGYITLKWYSQGKASRDSLLWMHVNGFDITFFGNTRKYDQLRELETLRNTGSTWRLNVPQASPGPPAKSKYESFMDFIGSATFVIHKGRMFIGSPVKPYYLLMSFSGCTGVHKLTASALPEDLYCSIVDMQFQGLRAEMRYNQDQSQAHGSSARTSDEEEVDARTSFKSMPIGAVMGTLNVLAQEFKYTMGIVEDATGQEQAEDPHFREDSGLHTGTEFDGAASGLGSQMLAEVLSATYGLIMADGAARVLYYADQPGLEKSDRPKSVERLPKWGVEVELFTEKISYGPWADYQRNEMQKFFFPKTYTDWQLYRPCAGVTRPYGRFEFKLEFKCPRTVVEVPFRHRSTIPFLPHGIKWDGTEGAMELTFDQDSSIVYEMPNTATSDSITTKLLLRLLNADLQTTLNSVSFLRCPLLEALISIRGQHAWNSQQDWDMAFKVHSGELWPLYDHFGFLSELKDDWTHVPQMYYSQPLVAPKFEEYLLYWIPAQYSYKIQFVDGVQIHMSCNPHNAIQTHNTAEHNNEIRLSATSAEVSVVCPFLSCPVLQENESTTLYDITLRHVEATLSLHAQHPIHNIMQQHGPLIGRFLTCDSVTFSGALTTQYPMPGRKSSRPTQLQDSCVFNIDMSEGVIVAMAPYIASITVWWANFFGRDRFWTTPQELADSFSKLQKVQNIKSYMRNYLMSSVACNQFEVYVEFTIRGVDVHLPTDMSTDLDKGVVSCYEFNLSVHSLPHLLDMSFAFSPLTLRIHSPLRTSESFLGVSNLTFHLITYNDKQVVYHTRHIWNIGTISGQLNVAELAVLGCWMQAFASLWPVEDNHTELLMPELKTPLQSLAMASPRIGSRKHLWENSTERRTLAGFSQIFDTDGAEDVGSLFGFIADTHENEHLSREFRYTVIRLLVPKVDVVVVGDLGSACLTLQKGVQFSYNTLNDTNTNRRATAHVPTLVLRVLATKREDLMAADTPGDHLEVGCLRGGARVRRSTAHSGVEDLFQCQKAFLLEHDAATRRLDINFDDILDRSTHLQTGNYAPPQTTWAPAPAPQPAAPAAPAGPAPGVPDLMVQAPSEETPKLELESIPSVISDTNTASSAAFVVGVPDGGAVLREDDTDPEDEARRTPPGPTAAPPHSPALTAGSTPPVSDSLPLDASAFQRVLDGICDSGGSDGNGSESPPAEPLRRRASSTDNFVTCASDAPNATHSDSVLTCFSDVDQQETCASDVFQSCATGDAAGSDDAPDTDTMSALYDSETTMDSAGGGPHPGDGQQLSSKRVTFSDFSPQAHLQLPFLHSLDGSMENGLDDACDAPNENDFEGPPLRHIPQGARDADVRPLSEYHRLLLPFDSTTDNRPISALTYTPQAPHLLGTHSPFPLRSFSPVRPHPKLASLHTLEAPPNAGPPTDPLPVISTNRRSGLGNTTTQMHVDLFGPVDAFVTPELVIMGAEWAMVYMQKESVLKKQQTWRPPSQTTLQPEPSREAPEVPRLRRARVAAKPRSRLRTIGTTDTILSCAIPHLQLRVFQALRPTSGPSGEMAATKLVLKGVRSVVLRSVASQDSPASLGYSVSSDMVYGTMQLLNRNSSRSPSVQVPPHLWDRISESIIPHRPVVAVCALSGLRIRAKHALDTGARRAVVSLQDVTCIAAHTVVDVLELTGRCWALLVPLCNPRQLRALLDLQGEASTPATASGPTAGDPPRGARGPRRASLGPATARHVRVESVQIESIIDDAEGDTSPDTAHTRTLSRSPDGLRRVPSCQSQLSEVLLDRIASSCLSASILRRMSESFFRPGSRINSDTGPDFDAVPPAGPSLMQRLMGPDGGIASNGVVVVQRMQVTLFDAVVRESGAVELDRVRANELQLQNLRTYVNITPNTDGPQTAAPATPRAAGLDAWDRPAAISVPLSVAVNVQAFNNELYPSFLRFIGSVLRLRPQAKPAEAPSLRAMPAAGAPKFVFEVYFQAFARRLHVKILATPVNYLHLAAYKVSGMYTNRKCAQPSSQHTLPMGLERRKGVGGLDEDGDRDQSWEDSATISAESMQLEYQLGTRRPAPGAPMAPASVTVFQVLSQALSVNLQNTFQKADSSSPCTFSHVCMGSLYVSAPQPLYTIEQVWVSGQEFLMLWKGALAGLQAAHAARAPATDVRPDDALNLSSIPRARAPSPVAAAERPRRILNAGMDVSVVNVRVSVHPRWVLCYSLNRIVASYYERRHGSAHVWLHLFTSRLASMEIKGDAPLPSRPSLDARDADSNPGVTLPEVFVSAEMQQGTDEDPAGDPEVRVSVTVNAMDTVVTHHILNQLITLQSRLEGEAVEFLDEFQTAFYGGNGPSREFSGAAEPRPARQGSSFRFRRYSVHLLLAGVRLTATSTHCQVTLNTGPIVTQLWKRGRPECAPEMMNWRVELPSLSLSVTDVDDPGEPAPPPANAAAATAAATKVKWSDLLDESRESEPEPTAATSPSSKTTPGPESFKWGLLRAQLTLTNTVQPAETVDPSSQPTSRATARATRSPHSRPSLDLATGSQCSPGPDSPDSAAPAKGSTPGTPAPTQPAKLARLHIDIHDTKILLRAGSIPMLSTLINEYRVEFSKFTLELHRHQAEVQHHISRIQAAKRLAQRLEHKKQKYLDEIAKDPAAFISSVVGDIDITNTSVLLPVGENICSGVATLMRCDGGSPVEKDGRRKTRPHVHVLDCIDPQKCVASAALVASVSKISLATLTERPEDSTVAASHSTLRTMDSKVLVLCKVQDALMYFDEGSSNLKALDPLNSVLGGNGCFTFGRTSFEKAKNSCKVQCCTFKLHGTLQPHKAITVKSVCTASGPEVRINASIVNYLEETVREFLPSDDAVWPQRKDIPKPEADAAADAGADKGEKFEYRLSFSLHADEGHCVVHSLNPLPGPLKPHTPASSRTSVDRYTPDRYATSRAFAKPKSKPTAGPGTGAPHPNEVMTLPLPAWALALSVSSAEAKAAPASSWTLEDSEGDRSHRPRAVLSFLLRSQDLSFPPLSLFFWKELQLQKQHWAQQKREKQTLVLKHLRALQLQDHSPYSAVHATAAPSLVIPLPVAWLRTSLNTLREKQKGRRKAWGSAHRAVRGPPPPDRQPLYNFTCTCRVLPFKVTLTCAPVAETYLSFQFEDPMDLLVTCTNTSRFVFFHTACTKLKLSTPMKSECFTLEVPAVHCSLAQQAPAAPRVQCASVCIGNIASSLYTAQLNQLYAFYLLWRWTAEESQAALSGYPMDAPSESSPDLKHPKAAFASQFVSMHIGALRLQVYDAYQLELDCQQIHLRSRSRLADCMVVSRHDLSQSRWGATRDPGGPFLKRAVQVFEGRLAKAILRSSKRLSGEIRLPSGCFVQMTRRPDLEYFRRVHGVDTLPKWQVLVAVPEVSGDVDVLGMRTILQLLAQRLYVRLEDSVDVLGARPYHVAVSLWNSKLHVSVNQDTLLCFTDLIRNVARVRKEQRQDAERRLTAASVSLRPDKPGADPSSTLSLIHQPEVPKGELKLRCDDLMLCVNDKTAHVQLSITKFGIEFAETATPADVDRVFLMSADTWSLLHKYASQDTHSVCAACNGPTNTMMYTKRGSGADTVLYQFSTQFSAQLETGANMADLKDTTDTLRQFFRRGAPQQRPDSDIRPFASSPATPTPQRPKFVAERFDFAPEVKWLGPLSAPFQTFLSWLGLSYEALPIGIDSLCNILEKILQRPYMIGIRAVEAPVVPRSVSDLEIHIPHLPERPKQKAAPDDTDPPPTPIQRKGAGPKKKRLVQLAVPECPD